MPIDIEKLLAKVNIIQGNLELTVLFKKNGNPIIRISCEKSFLSAMTFSNLHTKIIGIFSDWSKS